MDLSLMSDKKIKVLRKEIGMIEEYKSMYLLAKDPKPNQMKVYDVLAKKYGYANKESVNHKFQTLRVKYGKDLSIPKEFKNTIKI